MFAFMTLLDFFKVLGEFSTFAAAIPLGVGAYNFRRLEPARRGVWGLCLAALLAEQVARYYWKQNLPNVWTYHLLAPVLAVGWASIYRLWFAPKISPRLILGVGVLFLPYAVINGILWQSPLDSAFNSNVTVALAAMMVFFGVLYFYLQFNEPHASPLKGNFRFWINGGNLLYYSGSLFLFVIVQYLDNNSRFTSQVFILNAGFNITYMILLAVALWMPPLSPNQKAW
ncbi:MAG TPA: hypothetical protein DCE41_13635 [Cytophagales bacterium]|nr:hypothetical protein [Cytophagales bacterium]HAA17716.1 hypothetical protein [Cytophagales bacterium]HAP60018.1 hypothetical protein [Cytophagales bacterium]